MNFNGSVYDEAEKSLEIFGSPAQDTFKESYSISNPSNLGVDWEHIILKKETSAV